MPSDAVEAWLGKAAEDETVFSLIKSASGPWSQAAYHLQQASEKYVKAVLVAASLPPPKTHDLVHLLSLLSEIVLPKGVEDGAVVLSTFAWITRYPGSPRIERGNVEEAERHFSVLKAWCLQRIEKSESARESPME